MRSRVLALIGIVVVIFVIVKIVEAPSSKSPTSGNQTNSASSSGATLASSTIVSEISSVPETTLETIGKGSSVAFPQSISAPALSNGQKPEVFYEGAEYCPYCATERWAMAVALSKFGSFKNLKLTQSSSSDVDPNTNTLSFYGSTYTSSYINFTSVELYSNIPDNGYYTQLQTPTAAEQALSSKYDTSGSIPFIDFGGKFVVSGATYSPSALQGKSWSEIAGSLSKPNNSIAKGVDGAANSLTAAICELTNNQPGDVCNSTIIVLENSL
jgi:hypothetical protein